MTESIEYRGYTLIKEQEEGHAKIFGDNYGNLLVVLPTGLGKTLFAIMAVERSIKDGGRAIVMSPLRQLAEEQLDNFSQYFKTVAIKGGSKIKDDDMHKYECFTFTFEKLQSKIMNPRSREFLFDQLGVDTVVIDEIHNVGNKSRGANLEFTINLIKWFYPERVHVVGLSATIGNYEEFAVWLGADLVYADESARPVPLVKQVQEYNEWSRYYTERMGCMEEDVLSKYGNAKILTFVFAVGDTVQNANRFAMKFNHRGAMKAKANYDSHHDATRYCYDLIEMCGVGFHNASLDDDAKKDIVIRFNEDPNFKMLFSTTTLAQGIDIKSDVVVLWVTSRFEYLTSEEVPYEQDEIVQMIGRAGRKNKDGESGVVIDGKNSGLSYMFSRPEHYEYVKDAITKPVIVQSRMHEQLDLMICMAVYAGINKKDDLKRFFESMFGTLDHDQYDEKFEWLLKNKFLSEYKEHWVKAKKYAMVAAQFFIAPTTILHLMDVHEVVKELPFSKDGSFSKQMDYVKLYDLVLRNDEFLPQVVVRAKTNDKNCLYAASQVYNFSDDRLAKTFAMTFQPQLKGDQRFDDKFIITPKTEVYKLKEISNRFLATAKRLHERDHEHKKVYNDLETMINCRFFNRDMMKLSSVKGIGEVRLMRLSDNGINSIDKFIDADPRNLQKMMSTWNKKVGIDTVLKMQEDASELD